MFTSHDRREQRVKQHLKQLMLLHTVLAHKDIIICGALVSNVVRICC